MDDSQCVSLLIQGRVQGVFFRDRARGTARELDLRGWVRNRGDGAVEAVASGSPESVERFIAWCRQGPTAARVDRLEIREIAPGEVHQEGFDVRR